MATVEKAKVAFDAEEQTLVVSGIVQGVTQEEHHLLASFFQEKSPLKAALTFVEENGALKFTVSAEHRGDVVAEGRERLRLHKKAQDQSKSVAEVIADEKAQAEAKAAAEKAEAESKKK